jgi:5-methyltetrahydrofolate--homocysteine methyltransferase
MGFSDLLKSKELIMLDGAMGTELSRRKCDGGCACTLSSPETVLQIHRDYIRSGSKVILTNTLTMNRLYIESHNLGIDVEKVNREGARLAHEAAGGSSYVLGNLSSTGQLLEPYGTYLEEEFIDAFKEQAAYLAEGGVSGFIVETMIDLREAVCAVKACKAISALPVIACMAYFSSSNGGRTAMGNSAEECARGLSDAGADAIGANCGSIDPEQMAEIVGMLVKHAKVPIASEPNAGKPRLVGGTTVFDMEPQAFAAGLFKCREAGAMILGGCCGTSPEHIRAGTEALRLQ